MKSRLDALIQEAREEGRTAPPPIDWRAVDDQLFARIEAEQRADRVRVMTSGGSRAWAVGAALLAAAGFAVALEQSHGGGLGVSAAPEPAAGRLASVGSGATVAVRGARAVAGAELRLGDSIEVHGGSATVDRPGQLTMALEDGARATVTHTRGALVVSLGQGAVEAQVVPVASGEAFAVDVDGARVAVHGTHLRVARAGAQVIVDLTEGVVVVGGTPRAGSTVGALVTAPAHVEFSASDPGGTLVVSHEPSSVRVAAALTAPAAESTPSLATPPAGVRLPDPRPAAAPAPPAGRVAPVASSAHAPAAPKADPNAGAVVAAAVKACLASRTAGATADLEVSTTLHLELDESGAVKAARFDPPVAPDVNSCSATTIYKVRFNHDGAADVTVTFKSSAPAP